MKYIFVLWLLLFCAFGLITDAGPRVLAGQEDPVDLGYEYDFSDGRQGWKGGFADYPVDLGGADYELKFKRRQLPDNLNEARKGLFLRGNNHSDDLFMFVKRRLTGLKPNTTYRVRFDVQIATIAPSNAVGVGGSPGDSVYLKVGGAAVEPVSVALGDHYRMNIDKGNQAADGRDGLTLGTIGNSCDFQADCRDPRWEFKAFANPDKPLDVTTDAAGDLWVMVGTDSAFEGRTEIYLSRIKVTLREKN